MIQNTGEYVPCSNEKVISLVAKTVAALTDSKVSDIEFIRVFAGTSFPMIHNVRVDIDGNNVGMDAFITCIINQEKRTFRMTTNPDVGFIPDILRKINYIDGAIGAGGIFIRSIHDEAEIATKHQDIAMYILKEINHVGGKSKSQ